MGCADGPGTPGHRDAERTRERILGSARAAFARHGYDGTTVREIAAGAGVAPNLITRYFGGKSGLFRAVTGTGLGVERALAGPFGELGARLAAKVVRRWEGVEPGDPLLTMLRSAGSSDEAAHELGELFARQASRPLADHLVRELGWCPPDAEDRVAAVGALIMGVVTTRYVMRAGPLAEADPLALRSWLAERIQRLLDDPGPPPLRPGHRCAGSGHGARPRCGAATVPQREGGDDDADPQPDERQPGRPDRRGGHLVDRAEEGAGGDQRSDHRGDR